MTFSPLNGEGDLMDDIEYDLYDDPKHRFDHYADRVDLDSARDKEREK